MANLCAKLKQREKNKYRKIMFTETTIYSNEDIQIVSAIPYEPGALLEDGEWFLILFGGDGGIVAPEDSTALFVYYINCTSIKNLKVLDTSNVTNMGVMFGFCSSLESLDLSSFNTASVTSMSEMF